MASYLLDTNVLPRIVEGIIVPASDEPGAGQFIDVELIQWQE